VNTPPALDAPEPQVSAKGSDRLAPNASPVQPTATARGGMPLASGGRHLQSAHIEAEAEFEFADPICTHFIHTRAGMCGRKPPSAAPTFACYAAPNKEVNYED
jgi:hypothetical protein